MNHNSILYQQYSNQTTDTFPNSEPVSPLQVVGDKRFNNIFIRAEDYQTRVRQQYINPETLIHSPSTVTTYSKSWSPLQVSVENATSSTAKYAREFVILS